MQIREDIQNCVLENLCQMIGMWLVQWDDTSDRYDVDSKKQSADDACAIDT